MHPFLSGIEETEDLPTQRMPELAADLNLQRSSQRYVTATEQLKRLARG
jgi:hypothetical protein